MTAGMHASVGRGILQPGLLDHRQRVHVPTQQHRRPFRPLFGRSAIPVEHRHHRAQRLARRDLERQAHRSRSGPAGRPTPMGLMGGLSLPCSFRPAAREDTELVPLRIGETDPALLAGLADVGVPGAETEEATDLFVLLPVGWVDVEVEPVLAGLALRHAREGQRRRYWAPMALACWQPRRANGDKFVVRVVHLIVEDRAPEPRETARIGAVDRELGELCWSCEDIPRR